MMQISNGVAETYDCPNEVSRRYDAEFGYRYTVQNEMAKDEHQVIGHSGNAGDLLTLVGDMGYDEMWFYEELRSNPVEV